MRKEIEERKVREVMTADPVTVGPDLTIGELKRMFETHDFNMFPVVDAQAPVPDRRKRRIAVSPPARPRKGSGPCPGTRERT